jgi:hypothetical protein
MVYAYAAYGSLNYEICTENEILSGCYTVECDISTRSTGSCHFLVFHVWKEIQNKEEEEEEEEERRGTQQPNNMSKLLFSHIEYFYIML